MIKCIGIKLSKRDPNNGIGIKREKKIETNFLKTEKFSEIPELKEGCGKWCA